MLKKLLTMSKEHLTVFCGENQMGRATYPDSAGELLYLIEKQ